MGFLDYDYTKIFENDSSAAGENETEGGQSLIPPDLYASWFGGGEKTTEKDKEMQKDPFADDNFSKAESFSELINLVRIAEERFAANGIASSPEDVVWILRGIFYGTEWSMDYDGEGGEGSWIRNRGFDYYTKHLPPGDPRPALGPSLFEALRKSAEVGDPTGRHTDFGHIVIGVETQDWLGDIPTGTGGSGNEVVTWLGDIGGGAGMLAMKRGGIASSPNPTKKAFDMFKGNHDYGASINVEGDIAGTVGVVLQDGKSFSDVLEEYLIGENGEGGGNYNKRAELFLHEIGGKVSADKLDNKSELIAKLTDQFVKFGQFYSLTRAKDKSHFNVSPGTLRSAGKHMNGSATEIATIFVSMLEKGLTNPETNIKADKSMDPGVTSPASDATMQFEAAALAMEAMEEGEKEWDKRKGEMPDPGDWGF